MFDAKIIERACLHHTEKCGCFSIGVNAVSELDEEIQIAFRHILQTQKGRRLLPVARCPEAQTGADMNILRCSELPHGSLVLRIRNTIIIWACRHEPVYLNLYGLIHIHDRYVFVPFDDFKIVEE